MNPLPVVIDTNIVSGLARRDLPAEELAALGQIAGAVRDSRLTVWVTTNVREELAQIQPADHQIPHWRVYEQWREIPGYPSTQTLPVDFQGARPVLEVYDGLRTFLRDPPDAQITAAAFQANAPFIVTYDIKSFRRFSEQIYPIAHVHVRIPTEFATDILPGLYEP